jgi:pimeloyl-ACP methyl ester carboxylesterase
VELYQAPGLIIPAKQLIDAHATKAVRQPTRAIVDDTRDKPATSALLAAVAPRWALKWDQTINPLTPSNSDQPLIPREIHSPKRASPVTSPTDRRRSGGDCPHRLPPEPEPGTSLAIPRQNRDRKLLFQIAPHDFAVRLSQEQIEQETSRSGKTVAPCIAGHGASTCRSWLPARLGTASRSAGGSRLKMPVTPASASRLRATWRRSSEQLKVLSQRVDNGQCVGAGRQRLKIGQREHFGSWERSALGTASALDCDRQAGRLGAELPQSMLRKVPDAGHMIHHIVPEQVAAVILDVARSALTAAGRV